MTEKDLVSVVSEKNGFFLLNVNLIWNAKRSGRQFLGCRGGTDARRAGSAVGHTHVPVPGVSLVHDRDVLDELQSVVVDRVDQLELPRPRRAVEEVSAGTHARRLRGLPRGGAGVRRRTVCPQHVSAVYQNLSTFLASSARRSMMGAVASTLNLSASGGGAASAERAGEDETCAFASRGW